MNWKHVALVVTLGIGLTAPRTFAASPADDFTVLTSCYFRFLLTEQVSAQAALLLKQIPDSLGDEVKASTDAWYERQIESLRADLEKGLGDKAEDRFSSYVSEFTMAEKNVNTKPLAQWSQWLQLKPVPTDYPGFRKAVMESLIATPMADASRFLSEVQTWAGLRAKDKDVPPLALWLDRAGDSKTAAATPAKPKTAAQKLAEAEADTPAMPEVSGESAPNPLETFAAKRKEKRDKALADAEAGMQQVAAERQAAEEEYAAKKLAAAQADAENMKQHAEKLAATEKDALEQRKNSWGNRLKSIVGATVSAATGAFAGGIGARAGEEAVNAVFNDHDHR